MKMTGGIVLPALAVPQYNTTGKANLRLFVYTAEELEPSVQEKQ